MKIQIGNQKLQVETSVPAGPQRYKILMIVLILFFGGMPILAHQSHKHKNEPENISVHTIVSSIGYIVGAFGLIALWKTRKRKDKS